MNFKILGKVLLIALIGVILVASILPVSAAASKSVFYGTPEIDGKLDGIWANAADKIAVDMYFEGDLEDFATGYASVLWDKDNLYVLGYAYDKTKSLKESGTAWFTDGFEVFLDERYAHNSVKNEISQIRVNRNGSLSGMLLGVTKNENGILAEYAGTKWAKAEADDGYFVEIAIPWTRIKGKADKGTKIGLVFQINDDLDNDGTEKGLTVVNSETIDKWQPLFLMTFTLSSNKAEDPDASDAQSSPNDSTENKNESATSKDNTTISKDDTSTGSKDNPTTDSDKTSTGSKDDSTNDSNKTSTGSKDGSTTDSDKTSTNSKDNPTTDSGKTSTDSKDNPTTDGDDTSTISKDDSTVSSDNEDISQSENEDSASSDDMISTDNDVADDKTQETDGTDSKEDVQNVYVDMGEVIPKSIVIAFISLSAVLIIGIILCLVVLLKPKKKK